MLILKKFVLFFGDNFASILIGSVLAIGLGGAIYSYMSVTKTEANPTVYKDTAILIKKEIIPVDTPDKTKKEVYKIVIQHQNTTYDYYLAKQKFDLVSIGNHILITYTIGKDKTLFIKGLQKVAY